MASPLMDDDQPSPPSQTPRDAPILNYATPTRRPPARWLAGAALFCALAAAPVALFLASASEVFLLLWPILAMIATGLGIASLLLTPKPESTDQTFYARNLRHIRNRARASILLAVVSVAFLLATFLVIFGKRY